VPSESRHPYWFMMAINITTCMSAIVDGFCLMIGFIGLFDTERDYTLQFTIAHIH
jgi:hypothetical protein